MNLALAIAAALIGPTCFTLGWLRKNERAYQQGHADGWDIGRADGYSDGYEQGRHDERLEQVIS